MKAQHSDKALVRVLFQIKRAALLSQGLTCISTGDKNPATLEDTELSVHQEVILAKRQLRS